MRIELVVFVSLATLVVLFVAYASNSAQMRLFGTASSSSFDSQNRTQHSLPPAKQLKQRDKKVPTKNTAAAAANDDDDDSVRNLDAYKRLHARIINNSGDNDNTKVIFNLLTPHGYGNRVYSVLTTFVMAVLDDAAFIVTDWSWMRSFIREPMADVFDHGQFAANSTLNCKYDKRSIALIEPERPTQAWRARKDVRQLVRTRIPNGVSSVHSF